MSFPIPSGLLCPKCKSTVLTHNTIGIKDIGYSLSICDSGHLTLYLLNVEVQQGELIIGNEQDKIPFLLISTIGRNPKIARLPSLGIK